jgi:hypothetical protein
LKTTTEEAEEGQQAVWLYAVLDRDIMDFADFIQEDRVKTGSLELLYKMLTLENPELSESDRKLNKIGQGPVLRELLKRGTDPRPNLYTHILEEDPA